MPTRAPMPTASSVMSISILTRGLLSGPPADRAALEVEHRQLCRELTARQPILPGVLAYLEEGRRRGLKLAVASNSGHDHVDRHLKRLGLRQFFDLTCCREDVAVGKPAPEIYHVAAGRWVWRRMRSSPSRTQVPARSRPAPPASGPWPCRIRQPAATISPPPISWWLPSRISRWTICSTVFPARTTARIEHRRMD